MKSEKIKKLLPQNFQMTITPNSPLDGLLAVMEKLHEPAENVLENIEVIFNAYSTPDKFVPYLAQWLDLDRFFPAYLDQPEDVQHAMDPISSGNGRLRELMNAAAYISQWRGTAEGLICCLETATGIKGFKTKENIKGSDNKPCAFHIQVIAPTESQHHKALIELIIHQEKPAYVTSELYFDS